MLTSSLGRDPEFPGCPGGVLARMACAKSARVMSIVAKWRLHLDRSNVFEALMEVVKTHSLGQISYALYNVGGKYRRNM